MLFTELFAINQSKVANINQFWLCCCCAWRASLEPAQRSFYFRLEIEQLGSLPFLVLKTKIIVFRKGGILKQIEKWY